MKKTISLIALILVSELLLCTMAFFTGKLIGQGIVKLTSTVSDVIDNGAIRSYSVTDAPEITSIEVDVTAGAVTVKRDSAYGYKLEGSNFTHSLENGKLMIGAENESSDESIADDLITSFSAGEIQSIFLTRHGSRRYILGLPQEKFRWTV